MEHAVLENTEDISSDSDFGAPLLKPVDKEEQRAARAQKRAQKAAEIHSKAEVFRRIGDELFEKKKYEEAYIPYLEATQIWPSNVEYYILLASAYAKLQWYEESAHAATRALTLDPKSINARCIRASARLEQRMLGAAKDDLETILKHEPSHAKAESFLAEVQKSLAAGSRIGSHAISPEAPENAAPHLDFTYPHYDDAALEMDSLSDSSDCNHRGNGVPCRFYNRDRCAKGALCPYSHSPDEKSVRDELGRNVCTYFLLDSCKYGDVKCVYSHSKEFLPKRGWWTSAEQTSKVKDILDLTEKTAKQQRSAAFLLHKQQLKALKSSSKAAKPRALWVPKTPKTPKPTEAADGKENQSAEEQPTSAKKPSRFTRKARGRTREGKPPSGSNADPSLDGNAKEAAVEDGAFVDYTPNEKRVGVAPDVVLSY